uniref:EF-hand domain-containing protein n=1 Tax=Euplotes harpa TaxID=151035 RepID=A0A7S3NGR9_9SPIT|mmetsp:Transcript_4968/g.5856  ORF Transcript_4968/g.5856 Transcript_4968/m.5856 type:complete len:163 (+) Transcript_4968:3-491(+)
MGKENKDAKDSKDDDLDLTEEQKAELKEAFSLFDKDGDGTITIDELSIVMKSIGQNSSKEAVKEMIGDIDSDDDGEVSFEEFMKLMARKMKEGETDEELIEAFKTFDVNNNNYITEQELAEVMERYGEKLPREEIHKMFVEADKTGDGTITFEEFVLMMMAK